MTVVVELRQQPPNPDAHAQSHAEQPAADLTRPVSVGFPLAAAGRVVALLEYAAVVAAALLAKLVYLDWFLATGQSSSSYLVLATALGLILCLTYKFTGLYNLEELSGPEIGFGKLLGGLSISFLVGLGLLYAVKETESISRGWVFVWFALTASLIILLRACATRHVKNGMATGLLVQRIAVVGTRDSAIGVAQRILRAEGSSSAVDIYDSRSEDPDPRFVGGPAALQSAMSVRPYDRVVVAIPLEDVEHMQATVRSLGAYTTELLLCTDLTALPIATASARRIPGIRTEVVHLLPASESSWLVKRALDVIIATVALMFLAPLFALVALAIRLDSNGPVFFRQRRLGQNNVVFSICKFRSMAVIEDGPVISQATRDDRRVTKVGRLLRKTSIDELPQLINVLMGDMSIVGPRPHAVAHDHAFERQLDLFSRRRRVKPGMTGWAQVNGFRGEISTPEHLKRRMEHDLYYIDRWSIWLDVEIMARTVLVVAKGKGAY